MKSVLIYTVHKAASTFLHQLASEAAREFQIDHFSINDDRYHQQIKDNSWRSFMERQKVASCFGPIRGGEATPQFPAQLDSYSVLLQLRDPRDMLTSMFYSYVYSHRVKAGRFNPSDQLRNEWKEKGIDDFVLGAAPGIRESFDRLCQTLLACPEVRLLRYEEMVLDYRNWLNQFLAAFRHLPMPTRKVKERLIPHLRFRKIRNSLYEGHRKDFSVAEEDIYSHKRRITPGDHLLKLKPETIDQLTHRFRPVLEQLGYPCDSKVEQAA